jgi:hypothetical protein
VQFLIGFSDLRNGPKSPLKNEQRFCDCCGSTFYEYLDKGPLYRYDIPAGISIIQTWDEKDLVDTPVVKYEKITLEGETFVLQLRVGIDDSKDIPYSKKLNLYMERR